MTKEKIAEIEKIANREKIEGVNNFNHDEYIMIERERKIAEKALIIIKQLEHENIAINNGAESIIKLAKELQEAQHHLKWTLEKLLPVNEILREAVLQGLLSEYRAIPKTTKQ